MSLQVTIEDNECQGPSFIFEYTSDEISVKIDFDDNRAVNAFQWRLFVYKIENKAPGHINYTDDDGSIGIEYDSVAGNVTLDIGRADFHNKCVANSYITIPAAKCIDALTTVADAMEAWESDCVGDHATI
jgi:hypothetical protein